MNPLPLFSLGVSLSNGCIHSCLMLYAGLLTTTKKRFLSSWSLLRLVRFDGVDNEGTYDFHFGCSVVGFNMSGLYAGLTEHIAAFTVVHGIFLSHREVGRGNNIGLLASKSGLPPSVDSLMVSRLLSGRSGNLNFSSYHRGFWWRYHHTIERLRTRPLHIKIPPAYFLVPRPQPLETVRGVILPVHPFVCIFSNAF